MKNPFARAGAVVALVGSLILAAAPSVGAGGPCRGNETGPFLYSWLSYSTGGAIIEAQFMKADRNGNGLACLGADGLKLQDDHLGSY